MSEEVIVTGGSETLALVTVYNEQGFVTELPYLNIGRSEHGCGHFVNSGGSQVRVAHHVSKYPVQRQHFQVYLVTGGSDSSGNAISTTELLVQGESSWMVLSVSGDLPQPTAYLRSVSVNNEIIACGGSTSTGFVVTTSNIVKFDPSTLQWLVVATMKQPRFYHAMSVVNVAENEVFRSIF